MEIEKGMRISTFENTNKISYVNLINSYGYHAIVKRDYIEVGDAFKSKINRDRFSELLKNKIRQKKMSKDELSDKAGVTICAINAWLRGGRIPNDYNLGNLKKVLDITEAELEQCMICRTEKQ